MVGRKFDWSRVKGSMSALSRLHGFGLEAVREVIVSGHLSLSCIEDLGGWCFCGCSDFQLLCFCRDLTRRFSRKVPAF